jgi:hypothetical protein
LSLSRFGGRFGSDFSAGSAPEVWNVAVIAAVGTSTRLVASASAFAVSPPPPVAFPIANATPNAAITAAMAMAS